MIKKIHFALFFILFSFTTFSQSTPPVVTQVTKYGSAGSDVPFNFRKDASGNMYMTGGFVGTITFGSYTLTSAGKDVFVVKMNPDGSVVWAKNCGGSGYDNPGDVAIDAAGNVYITGDFRGTAVFGSTTLTSASNANNIFVAKLSPGGNWIWAQKAGSNGGEASQGVAVDQNGSVYVTGTYYGNCAFGSITILNSSSNYDCFVAKLTPTGSWEWAKRITGSGQEFGRNIEVDLDNNIYVSGFGNSSMTTQEGNFLSRGIFLVKYNTTGNEVWRRSISCENVNDHSDIAIDNDNGFIYVSSGFSGSMSTGTFSTNAANSNIFVAKYDLNNTFQWVTLANGAGSEYLNRISLSEQKDLLISGYFSYGIAKFGATNVTGNTSSFRNPYIAKIDKTGNWMWARTFINTSNCVPRQILENGSENYVVAGSFVSSVTMDGLTLTSVGNDDVFVTTLQCPPAIKVDSVQSCDSYTWIDGNTYTESNYTATHIVPGVSPDGCDSVYQLKLTIPTPQSIDVQAACNSFTWIDGNTYTSSNTSATYVIPGGSYTGCDSTITLNLTIHTPTSGVDVQTACSSFTWIDGNTYTSNTTTATHLIPNGNMHGCDSLVTLNLTINQPTSSIINQTACGSYTLNGQTYTSSGTYTQIRQNTQGCDSTITLNLIVNQPTNSSVAVTECETYTWPLNGQTYTTSGTYTHIIPNAQGCDSTITLNLTINQATGSTLNASVCESYTLNGQTYTASGTYTQNLLNAQGCDSTITLNLVIKQPTTAIVNHTACGSYTLNGQTYTTSGTYTQHLTNAQGCDSTLTLNLIINQSTVSTVNHTACGSYTLNGQTYTASGTYTQHLTNAQGCDSTLTLNLIVNQPSSSTLTHTACGGYTLNGQTYTSSGIYTQHLTNTLGCDSTLTLNLTIHQPTVSTVNHTACGSYTLNGQTYIASGTYTQHLMNAQGCDSTLTLNLSINQPSTSTVNHTACGSYTLNGQTYTASGTYTQNLTNAQGCDSTLTLNLVVNQPSSSTLTQTACGGYTLNGQTYTSSGTYTQNLTNAQGCDSIITLNLTVNQPSVSTVTHTACGSYTLNGQTYTASGTYTQNLTNAQGCDSTLTLNLTIHQPSIATVSHTACGSYTLNGQTYTASGTYTQNLTNAQGCDSTLTLNLVINQPSSSTLTQTACNSYVLNGQTYSNSGVYTQNLTNAQGCDSIITLNLTINQSSVSTITESACSSYTLNNETYTVSGTYTQVIPNANNCDSTITLNLTINQPTNSSVSVTACETYTWSLNNQTYTTSGTYTHVIPNANNCDSTITLNLTINQPTNSSVSVTACETYTWPLNNQTYTTSGTYTHVIPNANNCDSTITLNLTINQPTNSSASVTACETYTWSLNNQTYTSSGTYTHVIPNANNCDSTITLNLTINQPTSSSVSVTACETYTWTLNNQTYTSSGTYTHIIPNANNCDSTITLNLTINQPTSSSVSVTECGSYTWPLNNQTYTTSGVHTHVIPNANNCDSTITLNLTINTVNVSVTVSGITLTANQSGVAYQWINCTDNTPIAGATAQSYTPTENGNYAVEVTTTSCTETSDCIVINSVGIETVEQNDWSVYPNPGKGLFIMEGKLSGNPMISVLNSIGQELNIHPLISGEKITLDLTNEPCGVYLVKVGDAIIKLIKQ